MKKLDKKIFKYIFLLVLICLIIYLGNSLRKFIILSKLDERIKNYMESDNYYLKQSWYDIDNLELKEGPITEIFSKGNKYKYIVTNEKGKTITYYNLDEEKKYIFNEEEKTVKIKNISDNNIEYNLKDFGEPKDVTTKLILSFNPKVEISKNSDIYCMKMGDETKFINASTGYTMQRIGYYPEKNDNITQTSWLLNVEFDKVNDTDVGLPDLNQYTIVE